MKGGKGGAGPNGAKHGSRWLTPPGHVGSGREREREIEEKRETRGMRWADCEDDEGKETIRPRERERDKTRDKRGGEKARTRGTAGSGRGGKRAQRARRRRKWKTAGVCEEVEKRAQETREEKKRAQEAREEERRAQEAQEENRAREAREEQRRAQEAPELRRSEKRSECLGRVN